MNNVVPLHPHLLSTPEEVFAHATEAKLEHVIVAGIKTDGDNYFQSSGNSALLHLAWILVCVDDTIKRMINESKP